MFKEIKDERLQLQKYKAGFETFKIVIFLNFVVQFILVAEFGYENPMIYLSSIPFFLGLWIYEAKAQEAEEFDEEQRVLKATTQRKKWQYLSKSVVFVSIFGFINDYFFTSDQKDIIRSLIYGIVCGIGMALFEYFQMRSVLKKIKEEENVRL